MNDKVIIIGGGLSGLAAGIALARTGIDVTILEKHQGAPRDAFGFVLWPPATRTLRWLDVEGEVLAAGCRLQALRWFSPDQSELLSIALDRASADPFVGIVPSRLIDILDQRAEQAGVRILRSIETWDLHVEDGKATVSAISPEHGELRLTAPLVLGSDGMRSQLRERAGLPMRSWQPRHQVIITGIGPGVAFKEGRQTLGPGWADGCVPLGGERSWVYAIVRHPHGTSEPIDIASCPDIRPETARLLSSIGHVAQLRPSSLRVPRWESDCVLMIGDAAHGILPHLGLGASLSLEDATVLAELVPGWLAAGDTRAATLSAFRRRRSAEAAYFRRINERWAAMATNRVPGAPRIRDMSFRRLARKPSLFAAFIGSLARSQVPSLGVRLRMLLP